MISRRAFVCGCVAGGASLVGLGRALAAPGVSTESLTAAERFLDWLRKVGISRERPVRNLVYNFFDPHTGKGSWIFPMVTAKTVLWLLELGHVEEASAIADSLLRWQQVSREKALARCYGAFPSRIDKLGADWKAGDRFYPGDNLVVLEALVALYGKTKNEEYLNSAIGVGTWLVTVMCAGVKHGVWKEDHGAPMFYVTQSGDLSNQIHVNAESLWIGALRRLGAATGEKAYSAQAERAEKFFRRAQHVSGAYYDHYDPGWPPVAYDASRWRLYAPGQLIADNSLRAALGACAMGDLGSAGSFYRWLKTVDGAVPAYLNAQTGGSGFEPGQPIYYDVVASGLYRSLCQRIGEKAQAERAVAFLQKVQDPNGGFYWGCKAKDFTPLTSEQAPMTGLWAVADLSTTVR